MKASLERERQSFLDEKASFENIKNFVSENEKKLIDMKKSIEDEEKALAEKRNEFREKAESESKRLHIPFYLLIFRLEEEAKKLREEQEAIASSKKALEEQEKQLQEQKSKLEKLEEEIKAQKLNPPVILPLSFFLITSRPRQRLLPHLHPQQQKKQQPLPLHHLPVPMFQVLHH